MSERFSRNIGLFGKEGQERIEATHAIIVGLGGIGSHVAQQLAYLGVKTFTVVDPQAVDESNLNRLIGATEADAGVTAKVDVAARLISGVRADATVKTFTAPFKDSVAGDAAPASSVLFGCVDEDPVRLSLLQYAADNGLLYLDSATDISDEYGLDYGGRVFFNFVTGGCLSCFQELDQRALRRGAMTPEQLKADDEIYGVPRTMLDGTGPSVVSLNGVVASLAVTEFMVWTTGLRDPKRKLTYRASFGPVIASDDPVPAECYYCGRFRARAAS